MTNLLHGILEDEHQTHVLVDGRSNIEIARATRLARSSDLMSLYSAPHILEEMMCGSIAKEVWKGTM